MIDYTQKLSEHYTLHDYTKLAYFPHVLKAQRGLTKEAIIGNLSELSKNIVEPILKEFPGFIITSGFRRGEGKSQHNIGQAVDLQWPKKESEFYLEVLHFIRDNLPFDQLISEHGRSHWIHVSYNPNSTPRKTLLTYHPDLTPQYQTGLRVYKKDGTYLV